MHRLNNKAFRIVGLIFLTFSSIGFCDYIEPNAVQVKVKTYEPVKTSLPTGEYLYDISWQGIPVGYAGVDVNSTQNEFKVIAFAKSARAIDLVYNLRHASESEFNLGTYSPVHFLTEQTENSKFKKAEINFQKGGAIKSYIEKNGNKEEEREFVPEQELRDPISAAFLARSIDVKVGEESTFQIYNGKHRYLITFVVDGIEKIKVLETEREAFKITPRIQKLTDSEGEKRFRKGTIWMATDDTRDILKMESEVLIGSVKATLKSYKPREEIPPIASAEMARARMK